MQWHEAFEKKGLAVIMMSSEKEDLVSTYVSRVNEPITFVLTDPKGQGGFAPSRFPMAYLIDAKGKVIWKGDPHTLKDLEIVKALKTVERYKLPSVTRISILTQFSLGRLWTRSASGAGSSSPPSLSCTDWQTSRASS